MENNIQNSHLAPIKEVNIKEKSEKGSASKTKVPNYHNMLFFGPNTSYFPKEENQETLDQKTDVKNLASSSTCKNKDKRSMKLKTDGSEYKLIQNPFRVRANSESTCNFFDVQNNIFLNSMFSFCQNFVAPAQNHVNKKRSSSSLKKKKIPRGRLFKSDNPNNDFAVKSSMNFNTKCNHLAKSLEKELTIANGNVMRINSILQSVSKLQPENTDDVAAPSLIKALNSVKCYDESKRFHRMLFKAEQAHNKVTNKRTSSFRQKCLELKFQLNSVAKSVETQENCLSATQLLGEIQKLKPTDSERKHLKMFEDGLKRLSRNYKDAEFKLKVKETYEKIKVKHLKKQL